MIEEPINFITDQPIEKEPVATKKPIRPKPIKKPVPPKQDFHEKFQQINATPSQQVPSKPSLFQNPNQPKETMGYDTLNPLLYKFVNYLMLPSLLIPILSFIFVIINVVWFPNSVWTLYGFIICTLFSSVTFAILFLLFSTSLKRNDLIVIRKYRSGAGTISRTNAKGKSEIFFDKKDPLSKVLISWSGTITDPISGCKIVQISEGHPTNDNLNAQVSESEWDKDVARLTKAKSIADLAEAELFNQGILGLKWQDIVLILIALFSLIILGYLVAGAPDAIANKTMEALLSGSLQDAIRESLASAGILTPATV